MTVLQSAYTVITAADEHLNNHMQIDLVLDKRPTLIISELSFPGVWLGFRHSPPSWDGLKVLTSSPP